MQRLHNAIPLGRMAEPDEIGNTVAFLVSNATSYLTAATIFVDGGLMHSSPGL
jgi:glucose 1-dehydrogenase